jgi:peroxiredoxin
MPVLAASAATHSSTVRFIGVNMNDSIETAAAFAEKYNVLYDIMFDPSGSFISTLGIGTAPMTLFVDAQGIIVDQVAGEISADKLESLITKWFSQ